MANPTQPIVREALTITELKAEKNSASNESLCGVTDISLPLQRPHRENHFIKAPWVRQHDAALNPLALEALMLDLATTLRKPFAHQFNGLESVHDRPAHEHGQRQRPLL